MAMWNPWRGCHKCSEGCKFCYIHKGDRRRGINTDLVVKSSKFNAPVEKTKKGEYKMKPGQIVYMCFSSDFLIEDADEWRADCWKMIKERSDLHFIFLTKRIERFMDCIPDDWLDGYDNVTVGCTIENQNKAEYRLSIFQNLPIRHKNIICQPLIEEINIEKFLSKIELVVVGGESDYNARHLDYQWVLSLRNQCIQSNVDFQFRQCGTNFLKDGKYYKLKTQQLCSQAKLAKIDSIRKDL